MVDLCDADGTILREAAGNYANIFDDNFTGFAFGTACLLYTSRCV